MIFGLNTGKKIIIGGDKRGSTKDGRIISDSLQKLSTINNSVCLATAGNASIDSCFKVIINYFRNWITEENLQVPLIQKWISQECDKLNNTSLVTLSLHNEDFREGNIVISGDNPVLFDWKNTVISHPFFLLTTFLDDVCVLQRLTILSKSC